MSHGFYQWTRRTGRLGDSSGRVSVRSRGRRSKFPLSKEVQRPNLFPKGSSRQEKISYLKQMANSISQRIEEIDRMINSLEGGGSIPQAAVRFIAIVDGQRCNGCGICAEVCPQDAVILDKVARIDSMRCKGCGICSQECPQGAIVLNPKGIIEPI